MFFDIFLFCKFFNCQKMSKNEQCQSRFFSFNHFLDSPKRVLSSFGLSREFCFIFFLFQPSKTTFRPTTSQCREILIQVFQFIVYCFKFQSSTRNFPFFQSLRPVATNAKSYSVFLLKSARNCPPSKSCPKSKSLSNDKSQSMSQKRTVRQRFFNQQSGSFFIFLQLHLTTEAMGIWRVAGAFAVAQRQGECGSRTCEMHFSRQMRIGGC